MGRAVELLDELGIAVDPQLLELAFTHRSYAYEHGGLPHNERLEFLGDAVLGVIVTEYLYLRFPDYPEGRLAKLRAAVVNAHALAEVARSLDLGDELRLGKGETATGGHDKASILADSMEAFIGAVRLSAGRTGVCALVHHLFDPLVEEAEKMGAGLDWKTSLQEFCAQHGLGSPAYEITESGPDHNKRFRSVVVLSNGWTSAAGEGTSKKQAEQGAAEDAFNALHAQYAPAVVF